MFPTISPMSYIIIYYRFGTFNFFIKLFETRVITIYIYIRFIFLLNTEISILSNVSLIKKTTEKVNKKFTLSHKVWKPPI